MSILGAFIQNYNILQCSYSSRLKFLEVIIYVQCVQTLDYACDSCLGKWLKPINRHSHQIFCTNEVENLRTIRTLYVRLHNILLKEALPVRKIINNTRGNGKAEKDPKSIAVQG